jgi:hypothetical protein
MKMTDTEVLLNGNVLGYSAVYNLYKLIPFPTGVNNSANMLVFIESNKDYLIVDSMKQVYVKLNDLELDKCKGILPDWHVCKQTFPLKSLHSHQECKAKLLEPTTAIPLDCHKKIIFFNDNLVAPHPH